MSTETATFRRLADELVTLLAYEATREVRVQPVTVRTPLGDAAGVKIGNPPPLIVPVLRAGIGMLDGMIRLLPMADVGFVGLVRDEESLVASTYADRIPADLTGREAFVLDPMLATGGTLQTVIAMLVERGVTSVTAVCAAGRAGGDRPAGEGVRLGLRARRSGWSPRPWTTGWMSTATSTRAWATPATGCSARSRGLGAPVGAIGVARAHPLAPSGA